jgi:hypothetical protein
VTELTVSEQIRQSSQEVGMVRLLPIFVFLALDIYAVIDAIQTDDDRVKHLPKLIWILLILLFTPIGAVAWLVAGRDRGQQSGRQRPFRPSPPRGPDDDPDFLRNL